MENTKKKRSRPSKMNTLFLKDKSIMEIDQPDSLTTLAFASGDCFVPEPRCELCSSATHLKNISMDQCDEVLSRIFDVEVPDTAKICEQCVKCLKMCERFKILVNSSFVKRSLLKAPGCDQSTETERPESPINPQKEIIDLLTASLNSKLKKKRGKTTYAPPEPPAKRVNVTCTICQQKYQMLDIGINNFKCSRCKHDELKLVESKKTSSLPVNDLRSKNNLMGKNRLNTVQKYPHPMLAKPKHQCALCSKSYADPLNLNKHIRTMHESCYVCHVCGKKIKNKEVYEKHLDLHSSINSFSTYHLKRSSFKMASKEKCETFIPL